MSLKVIQPFFLIFPIVFYILQYHHIQPHLIYFLLLLSTIKNKKFEATIQNSCGSVLTTLNSTTPQTKNKFPFINLMKYEFFYHILHLVVF